MYGRIQRWGDSLGVQIPKEALRIARVCENDPVEIRASARGITLRKCSARRTLDDLFSEYRGDHHPGEWDVGSNVGLEKIE